MEIRLKGLTKIFPGNPKKHIKDTIAVNDLNMVVPDGKLVGLLGPSGCGKSTTLYMVSGLQIPTSGEGKNDRYIKLFILVCRKYRCYTV